MILSQTAVYALKAALYLAEQQGEGRVTVDDMAAALDVPRNYLSKILHTLARIDVLESTRGPGGGFRLVRAPADMALTDIVEHFDDIVAGSGCLLGRERCNDEHACPAHERWKGSATALRSFFEETTLADLSRNGGMPP